MDKKRLTFTALLFLPAIVQFFPMVYLFSISLKGAHEVMNYPPTLLPVHPTLENYALALKTAPLFRFLLNSLIVASCITVFQVVTSVFAAFALARLEFPGKKILFLLILATMMVPSEVTIIPNYFLFARLGWVDTYQALILPFSASGFGIFLLYQFFRTLPKELEEAVRLDGGSSLRFLFQFALPLSMPAVLAFSVYAFVNAWNLYLWPLIVTQSTVMQTAQIGIGMFRSENESVSWGVVMAATAILVAPTLLVFIATQRQFVKGIALSGVKG